MDFVAPISWKLNSVAYQISFQVMRPTMIHISVNLILLRNTFKVGGKKLWKVISKFHNAFCFISVTWIFYILVNANKILTCTGKTDKYSLTVWSYKWFQGNPKGSGNGNKNPTWQKASQFSAIEKHANSRT